MYSFRPIDALWLGDAWGLVAQGPGRGEVNGTGYPGKVVVLRMEGGQLQVVSELDWGSLLRPGESQLDNPVIRRAVHGHVPTLEVDGNSFTSPLPPRVTRDDYDPNEDGVDDWISCGDLTGDGVPERLGSDLVDPTTGEVQAFDGAAERGCSVNPPGVWLRSLVEEMAACFSPGFTPGITPVADLDCYPGVAPGQIWYRADDVDGDGLQDVVLPGVHASQVRSGSGPLLAEVTQTDLFDLTLFPALGDFDGDGTVDLAVVFSTNGLLDPSATATGLAVFQGPLVGTLTLDDATAVWANPEESHGIGPIYPIDLDGDGDDEIATAWWTEAEGGHLAVIRDPLP
ncbi:MAG: hypothetical protein H6736_13330 [Alphaproteobacteria bacterium]|nr:hypothetical protein [Alphaproteobacteria bacterium]